MTDTPSKKSTGRGRPALSPEKIADMRAHISQCALRLYKSEGYAAVSIRKVAAEAGCTVMTLYRYFECKIDILRYLWDAIFAELFDQLDIIANGPGSAIDRLNAVSLHYVRYWLDHREHYFVVFMSSDVSQSDVSVFVEDGATVARFDLFYQCIRDALDDTAGPEAVDLKAQTLLCGLNGIAHNHITISGFSWNDPRQLVRQTVAGIFAV